MSARRPPAKHARAGAACIAWALDGNGFMDDFMRPLLGRQWHARLRRAADAFRRESGLTAAELRRASDAAEGRLP